MARRDEPGACSACGRTPSPGAEFCGGCGSPLLLLCPECARPNTVANLFCESCGKPLAEDHSSPRTNAAPSAARVSERRYLTVMFCDRVGSPALSAGLDPEYMRRVIRGYQE